MKWRKVNKNCWINLLCIWWIQWQHCRRRRCRCRHLIWSHTVIHCLWSSNMRTNKTEATIRAIFTCKMAGSGWMDGCDDMIFVKMCVILRLLRGFTLCVPKMSRQIRFSCKLDEYYLYLYLCEKCMRAFSLSSSPRRFTNHSLYRFIFFFLSRHFRRCQVQADPWKNFCSSFSAVFLLFSLSSLYTWLRPPILVHMFPHFRIFYDRMRGRAIEIEEKRVEVRLCNLQTQSAHR